MSEQFKARKVWISKDYYGLPGSMREHVNRGGSLYMVEEPTKDTAFVSTDTNMSGSLVSFVDINKVWQEVRLNDRAFSYVSDTIQEHVNHNGKLYQIGGITESGNVEIAMDIAESGGLRTLVKQSDIEYVTIEEQEFANAVANIPESENAIEQ